MVLEVCWDVLGGVVRCYMVLGGVGRCWEVWGGVGRCWEVLGSVPLQGVHARADRFEYCAPKRNKRVKCIPLNVPPVDILVYEIKHHKLQGSFAK